MVDLTLFNDTSNAPITRFGGPFDDDDRTKGAYNLLSMAPGIIYYSPVPAEQLLTALDGIFPNLNLSASKHADSGCLNADMTGTLAGALLYWCLFEGPQGSAVMCVAAGDRETQMLRDECLQSRTQLKFRSGIDIVSAPIDDATTTVGAAAAIGMGSVVAPWYVPGFERTHEPTPHNDSSKDGYVLGLMTPELVHAMTSWQQLGYDMYRKSYNAEDYNDVTLIVLGGVEHDTPGPKMLFPIRTMTEQELMASWGGVERFGSCRPYMFSDLGTVLCDLDPHATAEQVDRQAHEMLSTISRWLQRGEGGTPSTSTSAADSHLPRLHDALKARLDMTLGRSSASASNPAPSAHPASSPAPMPSSSSAPQPSSVPRPGKRFCTSCGAQLLPNATFCGQCGSKVG